MTHQETGKTELPIELTVQERDQHNNLTGGWYYASDEEIIEAARNLPGAESGRWCTRHRAEQFKDFPWCAYASPDGPASCRLVDSVVIPLDLAVADARRTEEEG